jgi:hypothetical protein
MSGCPSSELANDFAENRRLTPAGSRLPDLLAAEELAGAGGVPLGDGAEDHALAGDRAEHLGQQVPPRRSAGRGLGLREQLVHGAEGVGAGCVGHGGVGGGGVLPGHLLLRGDGGGGRRGVRRTGPFW